MMTKQITVRIPRVLFDRMEAFDKATGVKGTEQVRRSLGAWLTEQEQFRAQLRKSLAAQKGGKA